MRSERIRKLINNLTSKRTGKGVDKIKNESAMRWHGHKKRMDENRMVKRAFDSELTGVRKGVDHVIDRSIV